MRILKVPLPLAGPGVVRTGIHPRFLAVGFQGEELVAWVEATVGDLVTTKVFVALTGEHVPLDGFYIGTAQLLRPGLVGLTNPYVVHVYAAAQR
jgi:hypothetical protein